MATATLRFEDFKMDAVDAIWERIQSAVAQGTLGVLGLRLWWNLPRMRRRFDQLGRLVSGADVRTEGDRKILREVAQHVQSVGDALSGCRDEVAGISRHLPFRGAILNLFDVLIVEAEDLAETAALGASAEFANLVREDLKSQHIASVDG